MQLFLSLLYLHVSDWTSPRLHGMSQSCLGQGGWFSKWLFCWLKHTPAFIVDLPIINGGFPWRTVSHNQPAVSFEKRPADQNSGRSLGNRPSSYHPWDPCMLYMVTFTINIPPMLAYIPAPWILWARSYHPYIASPGEQNFYTVVFAVSRTMGVMAQYIWSRAAPWRLRLRMAMRMAGLKRGGGGITVYLMYYNYNIICYLNLKRMNLRFLVTHAGCLTFQN